MDRDRLEELVLITNKLDEASEELQDADASIDVINTDVIGDLVDEFRAWIKREETHCAG